MSKHRGGDEIDIVAMAAAEPRSYSAPRDLILMRAAKWVGMAHAYADLAITATRPADARHFGLLAARCGNAALRFISDAQPKDAAEFVSYFVASCAPRTLPPKLRRLLDRTWDVYKNADSEKVQ